MTENLDHREILAERYNVPTIVREVRCANCGALLILDNRERWVHVHSGRCVRAEPDRGVGA